MRTRQAADALASRFVNVDAIPASLRHDIVDFLSRLEDDAYESRSAMLRSFLGLHLFIYLLCLVYCCTLRAPRTLRNDLINGIFNGNH